MASDVSVRDVRPDDAEAFLRAYEVSWDAALADLVGNRLDELASFEKRMRAFRKSSKKMSPDKRAWIAERDGTVVGVAVCARKRKICELRALYVVPDAWGSGAARALMNTGLAAMRERGATEATLWVGEPNARARRFYEREGWEEDGKTKRSLGLRELRYRRAL
jgi:GNAT superfamily N-acetyltransferase